MIDYEKLKLAHTLCKKIPYDSYSFDCWCCTRFDSGFFYTLTFEDEHNFTHEYESEDIDDLITKLKELTEPKPKYKVGQLIWFVVDSKIYSYNIENIEEDRCGDFIYNGDDWKIYESDLYPTKQALIESQIAYWTSLREHDAQRNQPEVDVDRCQHQVTFDSGFICVKCGVNLAYDGSNRICPEIENVCGLDRVDIGIRERCSESIGKLHKLECRHESDGQIYYKELDAVEHIKNFTSNPVEYRKCKHCGELYR